MRQNQAATIAEEKAKVEAIVSSIEQQWNAHVNDREMTWKAELEVRHEPYIQTCR
jgi:hypothetical protein